MFVSVWEEVRVRTRIRWVAKQSGRKSAVFNEMVQTSPWGTMTPGQRVLAPCSFPVWMVYFISLIVSTQNKRLESGFQGQFSENATSGK